MAMEKIEFSKAKIIAEKKGLKPGKVKGTEGIQFTKGNNNRLYPCEQWGNVHDCVIYS